MRNLTVGTAYHLEYSSPLPYIQVSIVAHGLALILGCLNDLILFKLAGKDMHKILDELEFQPDSPTYYIIYICFNVSKHQIWGLEFSPFMFQFVSKCFETIESVDLDIFSLLQFVSVVLLYSLYVSMFRNTRYGGWNFHLFTFQFVSKRFETIESVDLEVFSLFQYVSVLLLYNLYVSMFRNTRYGAWNFHLFMFQFVSKQLKVWT